MDRKSYFAALKVIRERYKFWKPRDDPYNFFDWYKIFSPAERLVWADIRFHGLRFYPQYPAGRYFIDFADPVEKIGIEVDGEQYHQDFKKDDARQKDLERMGWKIVRISGSEVYSNDNYLLEKLGIRHCDNPSEDNDNGEQWDLQEDLKQQNDVNSF